MKKQKTDFMRRLFCMMLCVLLCITALPFSVFASESVSVTADSYLAVKFIHDKTPISGAEFSLYRVADISEDGVFTLSGDFSEYPVSLKNLTGAKLRSTANTLAGYVRMDRIPSLEDGKTDKSGLLEFLHLTPGLYLLIGKDRSIGEYTYEPEPLLVSLPSTDPETGKPNYAVTVHPKYDREKEEERPDTITRKILKVWEDDGNKDKRPKSIDVVLMRDDDVYDEVTLSAKNNWRYTWRDLDADYKWTIIEKKPKGYTVDVSREGITFVITNTYKEEKPPKPPKKDPNLPYAGVLWWPVPVLAVLGIFFVLIGLLDRRGTKHEK